MVDPEIAFQKADRHKYMRVWGEVQEMILAEGGALLKKLLSQMLAGKDEEYLVEEVATFTEHLTTEEVGKLLGLEFWSTAVIGLLCTSRPLAKLILRLAPERRIFSRFAACIHCRLLFADNSAAARSVNRIGLRALTSLSLISKDIRDSIQNDSGFFASLLHLIHDQEGCCPFDFDDDKTVNVVSNFLLTLVVSEACKDLHRWLIEQGFCEAILGILSTSKDPLMMNSCAAALLGLSEDEDCRRYLKEQNAVKTLEPVSGALQLRSPCPGLWWGIKQRISMRQSRQAHLPKCPRPLETAIGCFTFCSWTHCEVNLNNMMPQQGSLPYKDLKKFAKCRLAHYCR
jgi:hypothetical protein